MLQQHRQPIEGNHSASVHVSAGRSGRLPNRPLAISLLLHVGFSHLHADHNTCSKQIQDGAQSFHDSCRLVVPLGRHPTNIITLIASDIESKVAVMFLLTES